jgi:hypothetical protein
MYYEKIEKAEKQCFYCYVPLPDVLLLSALAAVLEIGTPALVVVLPFILVLTPAFVSALTTALILLAVCAVALHKDIMAKTPKAAKIRIFFIVKTFLY